MPLKSSFCTNAHAIATIPGATGTRLSSKQQLQLHPHAADAAVGEIAIEETGLWSTDHAPVWDLSELRVVQSIECLPAKLQPLLLCDQEGFRKAHIKVVDAAGEECVAAYSGSIRQSSPLDPVHV